MTTSRADSRTWVAIGGLSLFILTAAIGWIQGLAFSESTALAGQTVVPSVVSITLALGISSAIASRLKYRLMLGLGTFGLSYNLIGSALLSAPSGIDVPFLREGVSLLYAAIMLGGGVVAGYFASLEPPKVGRLPFAQGFAVALGLGAFFGLAVGGLLEGTSVATAIGMGGQAVLPATFASWVGVQIRKPIWHRRLLGRIVPFALGAALFGVLMSLLAVPPVGIDMFLFSDSPAWVEGAAGLFGGAVAGGLSYLFDPDRDQPGNPAPA